MIIDVYPFLYKGIMLYDIGGIIMKKDQQDFESENMSDLVELINSKNNSRRILDVLRRNKKAKSKSTDKKWKNPVQNGLGFFIG